jgi:putative nucleotidyltransferase with HDIG domain
MERARDEFCKILALDDHAAWLRRADELGLLAPLLPEIAACKGVTQSAPHVYDVFEHTLRVTAEVEAIQTREYVEIANGEFAAELQTHFAQIVSAEHARAMLLRLAALVHDIGKPITRTQDEAGAIHFYEHETRGAEMGDALMRRLRFSNDEIEIITRVVQHHLRPTLLERESSVSNRAVHRFFRDAGDAGIDVCALALADRRGTYAPGFAGNADVPTQTVCARLLAPYFRAHETVIAPPALIDGRALMRELGLQPGKRVGELLDAIREAQVDGDVKSRDDAVALARGMVNRYK